jgi:predicted dithiol-disulfide oxidoreductase (DUF899 family)
MTAKPDVKPQDMSKDTPKDALDAHAVVSRDQWIEARKALLAKEKAATKAAEKLNEERRALPWVRIDKTYVFDGPNGKETLADLFDGRSQLFVQHFMFGPDAKQGCVGCSFQADHVDAARQHFEHNDVSFVAVSRAPLTKLEAFKARMGWGFKWVSSLDCDFNYDFHVSFTPDEIAKGKGYYNYEMTEVSIGELPGASIFYKNADGTVFHTYSAYARGDEALIGTYNYLDLMPRGRNETGPGGNLTDWVRHHDKYGT